MSFDPNERRPQQSPFVRTFDPPKLPRPWLRPRTLTYLLLLILVGPCVIAQVPSEIGRWKLAQALELRRSGQKDASYAALDEVRRWFPHDPLLLVHRADWRMEDGQKEKAIDDLDRLLELPGDRVELLKLHSQLVQNVGGFKEAVQDWEQLNKISERSGRPSRAEALNGLAYAQALAQTNLDQALKHVNAALELSPGNAGVTDTRGYVLYLSRQYEAALTDMNAAVQPFEDLVGAGKPARIDYQENLVRQSWPRSYKAYMAHKYPDPFRMAGVLYYHRALVLLALGRQKEADADLARVRELIGGEPDETLF